MRKSVPVWFLLALSTTALAGTPPGNTLDLDQAVSEGKDHSPDVQKAEAAYEEASWRKTESLSGFLPQVNASAEHYLREKYLILNVNFPTGATAFPSIFPTTIASLNVSVPLFDGLQNVFHLQSAVYQKSSADRNFDWTSFKVAQDIRLSYLRALAALALESVSQENLKTISDHLNQTHLLRQGGVATNYDVLRVEVQLNEAKSDVLQSDDNVILARKKLIVSMGLDEDNRELQGTLPVPNLNTIQTLQLPESSARADLQALSDQAEAASKTQSADATWFVPKLSLVGQYQEYNDLDSSWTNSNSFRSAYNFGLLLTWNLFDGMTSISRAREAVYQKVQADKSLETARRQVPYDFDFWKRRYLYSAALYVSKKSDVDRSVESVRLAREGFKAGTRTSTEVLDAELDLFRARAGVVNAQMDCAEAKVNLELALGRNI
jgi:outer membrane protein TolC